ncbi:hypothetical protein AFCDBAGC_4649 [Methylobacterium cerastii]|uniref:Uncharacterized protein n=1 Tax=Methylobacterium cerastii TaxID=932741 RepID=A0ABQ4QPM2_9HYPH|nr:hypothetical protein AFCDBAGC_4649 [Methylobacterium cerastii]
MGCWNFHIHCRPIASITIASGGGFFDMTKSRAPQTKKISVSRNGISIQLISIRFERMPLVSRFASCPSR